MRKETVYELYKNDYSHLIPFANNDSIKVFCEKITVKGYGWKETLLWNLATLGKVKVYAVYDKNKRIHTSYVVRGREKFLFLGKSDIEIGPCWTNSEYRGRGIYPMVLSSIIKNELSVGRLSENLTDFSKDNFGSVKHLK